MVRRTTAGRWWPAASVARGSPWYRAVGSCARRSRQRAPVCREWCREALLGVGRACSLCRGGLGWSGLVVPGLSSRAPPPIGPARCGRMARGAGWRLPARHTRQSGRHVVAAAARGCRYAPSLSVGGERSKRRTSPRGAATPEARLLRRGSFSPVASAWRAYRFTRPARASPCLIRNACTASGAWATRVRSAKTAP